MSTRYNSLHIYYNSIEINPIHLILNELNELMDQGECFVWFFVRYADEEGLHIRLRIDNQHSDTIFSKMKLKLNNKCTNGKYSPEIMRYSKENITQVESFFHFTSIVTMFFFREFKKIDYEHSLLISIALMRIIYRQNLTKFDADIANKLFLKNWAKNAVNLSGIKLTELLSIYKKNIKLKLDSTYENILQLENYIEINLKINDFNINLQNVSIEKKINIINSVVHMTNNKLGVHNYDEPYLAYFNIIINDAK